MEVIIFKGPLRGEAGLKKRMYNITMEQDVTYHREFEMGVVLLLLVVEKSWS